MSKKEYLTKVVNIRTGERKIERLIRDGWELTGQNIGSTYSRRAVLRKPNPKFKGTRTPK